MRSSIIFFIAIATLLITFVHARVPEYEGAVPAIKPSSGRAKLMRKRGPGGPSHNSGGGRGGASNGASNTASRGSAAKPAGSSSGGGIGGGLLGGSGGGGLLGGLTGGHLKFHSLSFSAF
ncbi:hypothetical protein BD770DRAFT_399549 [Pilaira anomala]|nr:hypothetical protein BD770DRAFT_399549 [Pilaira anomala]